MDFGSSADLTIRAVSTDPNGSGGHRGYHPPPQEEAREDSDSASEDIPVDTDDVVRLSAADALTRTYHAVAINKGSLQMLNTDFHLQWASLVADAATGGAPWHPRYRACDLQRQRYSMSLPINPCEALVNRIIKE